MVASRRILFAVAMTCVLLAIVTPASAQTASALLREGDELPGAPGELVNFLNNPVVNHAGGYAISLSTTGSGTTLSHIWGNGSGGPGTVIITEGTYGDFTQTAFESFHGLSNAGLPCYGTTSTRISNGHTGLDGVWIGTTPILHEEDTVPTLPGQFSTFNSRPGCTADSIPYWVGGIGTTQGGSSQNRVLFYSTGLTPLLKGGDSIGGVAEPVETNASNIGFDYRLSALGTYYIVDAVVDSSTSTDTVMVVNMNALMLGGGIVREGSPVPAAIGGLAGENWSAFDLMGISESGNVFLTGDTSAAVAVDEFVVLGGQIVRREGDVLDTLSGPVTVAGAIEGAYVNENGDWAATWDVVEAGSNLEALIFNGELILLEGDAVDLDGNGIVEPASILRDFTGITTVAIGDRDMNGVASVYFTADIDTKGTSTTTDDTEGYFRVDVQAGTPGIELPLDIKPGSCPNSYNAASEGVLPVAILGAMDFDVSQIDVSTVRISRAGGGVAPNEGPPGPHSVIADVGTPFVGEGCECHGVGGDGIADLSLHFLSELVGPGLGLLGAPGGESVELTVTGMLSDGTPFFSTDCVRLVPPNGSETESETGEEGQDPLNSGSSVTGG